MTKHLAEIGQAYTYLAVVRNFTTSSLIHPTVETRGDCFMLYLRLAAHYILIFYDMDCHFLCHMLPGVAPLLWPSQQRNAFSTRHKNHTILIYRPAYVCVHIATIKFFLCFVGLSSVFFRSRCVRAFYLWNMCDIFRTSDSALYRGM